MKEPSTEHGCITLRRRAAEGGEPHGWGESDTEHGRELERPPSDARQAAGDAHAKPRATEYLCIQTTL